MAAEDQEERWWSSYDMITHVRYYMETKQLNSKEAIKQVAKDRDIQKREVYQAYHIEEQR